MLGGADGIELCVAFLLGAAVSSKPGDALSRLIHAIRSRARIRGPFRLVMPISFFVEMREYATQQHWALNDSEKPVDSF
jgi:hypothetical protein